MKYNLKNRPNPDQWAEEYYEKAETWFEGFEKELQQKRDSYCSLWYEQMEIRELLEEILGSARSAEQK